MRYSEIYLVGYSEILSNERVLAGLDSMIATLLSQMLRETDRMKQLVKHSLSCLTMSAFRETLEISS